MTFVLAGHETTANLLNWTLYILMTRPTLWAACVAEARTVCGTLPPQHSDLSRLLILDAVLQESLRLFPPVPVIARQAADEQVVGEGTDRPIHVPKGTFVQIAPHIVHRLTEYWGPTAGEFDHTRWMKKERPYSHPMAFLPFSAGPRNCIGQQFAMAEAKVVLVLLLQRVRMEWVEGQKMDEEHPELVCPVRNHAVSLRPLYDMMVRVYRADA